MGYVTHYTWNVTLGGGWTFSQNFNSLALMVWERHCIEDIWTKGWLYQKVSDRGDCRTAPGTPGLLFIKALADMFNRYSVVLDPPIHVSRQENLQPPIEKTTVTHFLSLDNHLTYPFLLIHHNSIPKAAKDGTPLYPGRRDIKELWWTGCTPELPPWQESVYLLPLWKILCKTCWPNDTHYDPHRGERVCLSAVW